MGSDNERFYLRSNIRDMFESVNGYVYAPYLPVGTYGTLKNSCFGAITHPVRSLDYCYENPWEPIDGVMLKSNRKKRVTLQFEN